MKTPAPVLFATRALLIGALAIGLAGCGALSAQNPSSALQPVNAVEIAPDARVMLKGADVVFHFASAEHKAAFDQAPQNYLPQFGGNSFVQRLVFKVPHYKTGEELAQADAEAKARKP